jgi:hypothetical protein
MRIRSLPSRLWFRAFCVAMLVAGPGTGATREADDEIRVDVQRSGETALVIDVVAFMRVPQREAWDVLTDFDRMAEIVSNLRTSRVLERNGTRIVVEQRGGQSNGVLRFDFETVREVELVPYSTMHSHLLRGSIKRMEGWTRLVPVENGTYVVSHGEIDTGQWLPPMLGPHFVGKATRRQYEEMRAEMIRRTAAAR